MRALLSQLDDPQASLSGVLIAGTNGKGSVAEMVASMARSAGYRTSQAPSPHLGSYRERILMDGQPIALDDLEALLEEVLIASEPGEAAHGPATEFELLIAAAFLWSLRQHVDVAVIEVGLGGRLDATNTWDADVTAVTSVALDHEQFLGRSIEAVAREKAAIIKRGSQAVTGAREPALGIIRRRAARLGVPLTVCTELPVRRMDAQGLVLDHDRLGRLRLPLLGRHQALNAAIALGIVQALSSTGVAAIDDAAIVEGLARTHWPGRLETITHEGRSVILDGAHNPEGAAALAAAIDELAGSLPSGRATLVLAIMSDKEVPTILAALAESEILRTAHVVATSVPDTPRSTPAPDLAQAWVALAETHGSVSIVEDADAALDQALTIATRAQGPLIVAGSLYLVGHLRAQLVPGALTD